jgi:hypothetical protein
MFQLTFPKEGPHLWEENLKGMQFWSEQQKGIKGVMHPSQTP